MNTLHKTTTSVLLLLMLLGTTTGLYSSGKETVDKSSDVQSIVVESDRLFEKRSYRASLNLLKDANKRFPNEPEVLWRLANHMINEGDASRDDEKKQEEYYRQSMSYAKAAVRSDSKNAYAHALLAAAYGSYGMFAGGKEKVKLANMIRDELDHSLDLDGSNQYAHTIYGTWHREVSEVSWVERQLANMFLGSLPDGSLSASIKHFKNAIASAPNILRHHYELGLTYIAADEDDLAAAAFRRALSCPDMLKIDPERRRKMKEWLADL